MWLYIALGLIALAYYVFKSCKYDHWEKKGVPTASGNEWFFGHYKPIMMVKKHAIEVYEDMYKEFPDAPMVGYYVMGMPGLLVKDMDIIKTILVSEFSSFNFNGITIDKKADPVAAFHPFILKGDEWKTARAQVTPSLSLVKLKGYLHNILKVGDEMVKYVTKNCETEVDTQEPLGVLVATCGRDVATTAGDAAASLVVDDDGFKNPRLVIALMYSTDVIANAIYGIENNTFENKDSLVASITREMHIESSISYNLKFFFQILPIVSQFFPPTFVTPKLRDMLVPLTRRVVEQRMASGEKRNDFIQLLITQKENDTKGVITYEYMSGQVFILIIDLYETSSSVIGIMLYMISRQPDIQEKLRSEIRELKSRSKEAITVEDIEGARYLDMVYNESLRYFSFFLSRECTSDCYVKMPGSSEAFKITKGTSIVIPASSIHKDPKYYPDPEKFYPERFTEEEVAKRPRFSFLPFGEGPKKCIGYRLVGLHVKAAIIKILDNFKLTPSPKTKYPFEMDPRFQLTFRPKEGTWVIFESIK